MDTGLIIWSSSAYKLQDIVDNFELPQLVTVEDGYYDEKDETTLSRDDVLTLHMLQKTRFYRAVTKNGKGINIPVTLAAKVETVSKEPIITYQSIEKLVKFSAKRVKSLHSHPWLLIEAGDTLQVQSIINVQGVESLRLSFISKTQKDVNIPITYKAVFQTVPDITELWLTEIESAFPLPIKIRFIDRSLQVTTDDEENYVENVSSIADLGEVTLEGIEQVETFIASTRYENRTVVLKVPVNTEITVKAGVGIQEGDYTYTEVCQMYHQKARLEQLDHAEMECIKIGETDAKVERIYEFVDEFSDEDDEHDYEYMVPEIPSRIDRPPLHPQQKDSDDSSNDDDDDDDDDDGDDDGDDDSSRSEDYEDVVPPKELPEIPPPIPKRVESKKTKSSGRGESICNRIKRALCGTSQETSGDNNFNSNKSETSYEVPEQHGRYVEDSAIRSSPTSGPGSEVKEPDDVVETELVEFPKNLGSLNVEGVVRCLKMLNMEYYVERFRNEQINGKLFIELTDDLLISLGVSNKFQRIKLLKFIEGWRPN